MLAAPLQSTPLECAGVPKEVFDEERRVAQTPEKVSQLVEKGFNVVVESGAGLLASYTDKAYEAAGARIASSPAEVQHGEKV